MAFPLTDEQRRVVDDRGGELLVSAAAGSGKTRVLVERLLDRVTGENMDIDRFLVITYTRAAAAELRERIAQELTQRLARQPGNAHLRRQIALVHKTQISTIHSLCSAILRESGHELGLNSDFRLCDEGEGRVLKGRVLTDLLERSYEGLEEGSEFAALVDTMAAGRDDSALEAIVLDIFERIQSHPNPRRWLEEEKRLWYLDGITDAGETPWGRVLLEEAGRQADYAIERLRAAVDLCDRDAVLSLNYGEPIAKTLADVCTFREQLEQGWDRAAACLPIQFYTPGRKTGVKEQEIAQRVKNIRTKCKKDLDKLCEVLEGDSGQILEDLRLAAPAVRGLMDLVLAFHNAYQKEKRKRSLLDFSDLEHYTVQLLADGAGEPTPLAAYWSEQFEEVMVDEYQDTNQVQNVIFKAISQGGRTLVQVGDVKQSIYRFRLADPTIFLGKYQRFPAWNQAEDGQPRTIVLSRNFRSRAQVLEGCNDLFRAVMSREFGELDYTKDQELVPGAVFPEDNRPVELALLDESGFSEEEGGIKKGLLEARWAAGRIRELLDEGFMIGPEGERRKLEPSDVMILLRSPGTVLHHYIWALSEQNIPWSAEGSEDIFDTTEVNVALSLLQVVDNPRQDVALIAVLRSPVYGFSGDKLARLRAGAEGDFYSAVVQAAQEGDEECCCFVNELEQLRFGAGDKTCCQLIWHIYERTNLLGIFGTMDQGETRQNNLLALYSLAGQLEASGCRTLFQFLIRLERLRETESKLPLPVNSQGGGVSIMSIHRSKGLEKPVVLLCGLSKQLNRVDMYRPVLFHPRLGVGPRGLDRERMVEYPTLARKAVARALEREMMAEELRLLYVAMTRAREKLIMSMALTDGVKNLERLAEDITLPVSPMALERQAGVGGWVLLHVLTRPEAEGLRAMAGLPDVVSEYLGPAWDLRWVDTEPLGQRLKVWGRFADRERSGVREDEQELLQRLQWAYPHQAATQIPSKLSATQIKGRVLDQEAREGAAQAGQKDTPWTTGESDVYTPNFVTEQRGLTPSQKGTAIHLAMQHMHLQGCDTVEGVQRRLDELEQGQFMTRQQKESVDPNRLAAFFASELGREMSEAVQCEREFKFTVLVPAVQYYPEACQQEEVLLQGVVDAWFGDGTEITLIDFKSDRVTPSSQAAKAEEYRIQLDTYRMALEKITGLPVKRRILWFFSTDSAVEL